MFESLKAGARRLRAGRPGHRFREFYDSRAATRPRPMVRIGLMLLGGIVVVLGILQLVIPGPGILVIALGGALLASQSRQVARFLDRVEVVGRRWARRALTQWRRFRNWQKMALALVVIGLLMGGLAAGYGAVTGK